MLTHGHGDGVYPHYCTFLWPGDSNYTISSICRVLRALERPHVKETWNFFQHPPQNYVFAALLHRKSRCLDSLAVIARMEVDKESSSQSTLKPLPKNLYL